MFSEQRTRVLLVEDNPGDARLVFEYLAPLTEQNLSVEHAGTLAAGLERLAYSPVDVVLLDLNLPDSDGIETFRKLRQLAGDLPVVMLTRLADDDLAERAVREGAQDFLVKGRMDGFLLARSIRYAIERKRAELALEASEDRYRMLAEHATDMISQHTEEGMFLYVSPVCRKLLGYDPRQMEGRPACDFVHADDVPLLRRLQEALLSTLAPGTQAFRARKRDGNYTWVETSAQSMVAFPGDGTTREIIAITRDIGERKRAEQTVKEQRELHSHAITGMAQGVVVADRDLTCRLWNPYMEQLTGRKAEEVMGTRIGGIFPFAETAGIGRRTAEVLLGKVVVSPDTPYELFGGRQSGWTVQTASPLHDVEGGISGIIVTVTDITQRKLREARRP